MPLKQEKIVKILKEIKIKSIIPDYKDDVSFYDLLSKDFIKDKFREEENLNPSEEFESKTT